MLYVSRRKQLYRARKKRVNIMIGLSANRFPDVVMIPIHFHIAVTPSLDHRIYLSHCYVEKEQGA